MRMVVLVMAKKKKARKKVKRQGRPTKYESRYCRMLISFFDIEPFKEMEVPHYDESGKKDKRGRLVVTWIEIKREANRMPTLQRFAKKIGIGISTIYDWLNKEHPSYQRKFSDAFACARELRRNFLIENGLVGTHQHSYAKFVAINLTDMKDTLKQEVTGADGEPLPPIQVNVIAK